jgi:hypothetical protein
VPTEFTTAGAACLSRGSGRLTATGAAFVAGMAEVPAGWAGTSVPPDAPERVREPADEHRRPATAR